MPVCDGSAKDTDVGALHEAGNEHDRALRDAPGAAVPAIGQGVVAGIPSDLFDGEMVESDTIFAVAEELDECLWRIGKEGWWRCTVRLFEPGFGTEVLEGAWELWCSAGSVVAVQFGFPLVEVRGFEISLGATPEIVKVGEAVFHRSGILGENTELGVGGERGSGKIGGSDDGAAGTENVELGVESLDAADSATVVQDLSQSIDVAHTLGKVRKIEAGDDLKTMRLRGEKLRKRMVLDEWADDAKSVGISVQGVRELGVPGAVDETKGHGCFLRGRNASLQGCGVAESVARALTATQKRTGRDMMVQDRKYRNGPERC